MGPAIALLAIIVLGGSIAGVIALFLAFGFRRVLADLFRKQESLEADLRGLQAALVQGQLKPILERPSAEPEPLLDEEQLATAEQAGRGRGTPETLLGKPAVPPTVGDGVVHSRQVPSEPAAPPIASAAKQHPSSGRASSAAHDQQWWANVEEALGKRWMTWAGALTLFLSVGFFVKYAFDNQWLGPTGRVVLGITAGLVLLAAGDYFVRDKMRALGQGLMGGGLGMLYVSIFAAFSLYQLIPQVPAFGSLVFVTALGMALAVLHDAMPLGIIACLGGFISPTLVATGVDPRDGLFAYLTVLDLGVLGVAFFKRWRALDFLAFVGTWAFFFGWFNRFYTDAAMTPACLWTAGFFLIFLVVPFAFQLKTATGAALEGFLLALANAVVSFGLLYRTLQPQYSYVLGFVALAMAACYIVMAAVCRSRVPGDAKSLFGFVGLSVVLLTLAVPLHLGLHGITLAWAVEGPVLLFLGYQFNYRPVRIAGLAVLFLAGVRLFSHHWPFHNYQFAIFLNREFATAMFVPAAMAAYGVIHHVCGAGPPASRRYQATNLDRILKLVAAICAGFAATVIVQEEVGQWAYMAAAEDIRRGLYLTRSVDTLVWAAGSAGFLAGFMLSRQRAVLYSGIAALSIAVLYSVGSYGPFSHWKYDLFLNARFFTGAQVVIAAAAYAFVARNMMAGCAYPGDAVSGAGRGRGLVTGLCGLAGVFPLFLLSLEVYRYCQETIPDYSHARWLGQMGLSLVWSLYACAALAAGFWRSVRAVRFAALGLLAITGMKLLLVDMSTVREIYRIVSFVVLGLVMIGASYLYHRLEKRVGG